MYFTKGILINKQDKGENDKLITVYTKDYGKVGILAKGVRKPSSKLASQLDLFNFIEVGFVHGNAFKILTSVVALNDFQSIKKHLDKSEAALRISNLVNKHIIFEDTEESISNILYEAFIYLEMNDFSALKMKFLLRYFEFKLLSILGYRPPDSELPDFLFISGKKADKKSLDDLEYLFLRYFENIV